MTSLANSHDSTHNSKHDASHQNDDKFRDERTPLIEKLIEDIRKYGKKTKKFQDDRSYYPCHYCKELLEMKYLVHCTKIQCSRYFCLRCLNQRFFFQTKSILDLMKMSAWDCFVCRNICLCRSCRDVAETAIPGELAIPKIPKEDSKKGEKEKKVVSLGRRGSRNMGPEKTAIRKSSENKKRRSDSSSDDEKKSKKGDNEKSEKKTTKVPARAAKREKIDKVERKKREREENMKRDILPVVEHLPPNFEDRRLTKSLSRATGGVCHLCTRICSFKDSIRCTVDNCGKRYCADCTKKNIDKTFVLKNANLECWICYACGGTCTCDSCKNKRKAATALLGVRRREDSYKKRSEQSQDDEETGKLVVKKRKYTRSPNKIRQKPGPKPKDRTQERSLSATTNNARTSVTPQNPRRKATRRKYTRKTDAANSNYSQVVTKKKVEINTTVSTLVNTTNNMGSPTGMKGVKIIQEIKSDEYKFTVFDAENVEELRKMENIIDMSAKQ
jgi:hypothetical protein